MLSVTISVTAAQDINWSMRPSRNGASPATNLPAELGDDNVVWQKKVGTHQYSIPVIEGNRIYLGVNDSALRNEENHHSTGGGMVLCLDRSTGKELWKHVVPRFIHPRGLDKYFFNNFQCGICSSPVITGKRLYVVGGDATVRCLNKADGSLVWIYRFIDELDVVPHDVCGSTILLNDGKLYVCTSNGTDQQHASMPNPKAPSLIVLDEETGKLLALADENISEGTSHGQWSSPAFGRIKGKDLIFFGGGNGKCYAFEALKTVSDKVQTLKRTWVTDCNPHEYRFNKDGTKIPNSSWRKKTIGGPNPIIGTAVVFNGRVYVAIGQSPYHGRGNGMLNCLDAETGKVIWRTDVVKRTTATVAIADGLLYVSDFSEQMHCIDAETGKSYWIHELESDVWCASPVVADGKVYIGTSRNHMWIFKAAKKKELLSKIRLDSTPTTVVPVDGQLYVPTQRALTVYK
jgi:outer membrane protein assembly factor BamB